MATQTRGPIQLTSNSVEQVKDMLLQEGFYDPTILQTWKEGQVFGLVKKLGDLEIHARGYNDNTLDSEIELSRDYLEHPGDVRPYYGWLLEMLARRQIPYWVTRDLPPDPQMLALPQSRTPWMPIAVVAGIAIGGTILAILFGSGDED